MRLRILFLFVLSAMAMVFAACADPAKPPVAVNNAAARPAATTPPRAEVDSHGHAEGADAPRIQLAEAKKDFDAGTAVFIDTHAPEQFAQQHIPGAINIPANNPEPYLNKIPKGKKIIAYCS